MCNIKTEIQYRMVHDESYKSNTVSIPFRFDRCQLLNACNLPVIKFSDKLDIRFVQLKNNRIRVN